MTEFVQLTHAPTREEHDAVVARRGRSYTDRSMREARPVDNDATDSGLSIVDQVVADSRRVNRQASDGAK